MKTGDPVTVIGKGGVHTVLSVDIRLCESTSRVIRMINLDNGETYREDKLTPYKPRRAVIYKPMYAQKQAPMAKPRYGR